MGVVTVGHRFGSAVTSRDEGEGGNAADRLSRNRNHNHIRFLASDP